MLKDFHTQKEFIHGEHEKESEQMKSSHRQDVLDLERRMHARQEKDSKVEAYKLKTFCPPPQPSPKSGACNVDGMPGAFHCHRAAGSL